ncbi:hypothetical protein H4218_004092 [Coemansia sp. IMI 209128]|nr:hypothetical protein GGI10_002620 [Coemansia sp. RSA 2530]KAJ2697234.1 hypothetical protein H4218_004092 [Coemansia sp. IMI 209128]
MNREREKTSLIAVTHDSPGRSPSTRQERSKHLAIARGVGIFLLSIPTGLLLLCLGSYIYGRACPAASTHRPHGAPEYLSLNPVNKHHAAETHSPANQRLISNGTHWFKPTIILVSLDGFRADYLDRGITPELLHIGRKGLRADYMIPSFPSSTFPNHYSIATGLYPGSHGMVSNEFYDSVLNDTFSYKDAKKNLESRWWEGGEPIWVTAEKQGQISAINMWPGSTAVIHGYKPTYVVPFSHGVAPLKKISQLMEWLDLPQAARPSFLATYMPEVDSAAHQVGPDSKQVNEAVQLVDGALGELWRQIAQRNLTHIVNLMVVSDHGMAATQAHKYAIYVDDIIDVSKVRGIYGWPLGGVQPKNNADTLPMYRKLKRASKGKPWAVYLRENIPERFHYTHQARIAPIMIIPELPYYVTTMASDKFHAELLGSKEEFPVTGAHGYDNLHPLMRATFLAAGPAFRSRDVSAPPLPAGNELVSIQGGAAKGQVEADDGSHISDMDAMQDYLALVRNALVSGPDHTTPRAGAKHQAEYDAMWGESHLSEAQLRNIRYPPFENVELYGMMTRILDLKPAPNNGTTEFSRWWLQ